MFELVDIVLDVGCICFRLQQDVTSAGGFLGHGLAIRHSDFNLYKEISGVSAEVLLAIPMFDGDMVKCYRRGLCDMGEEDDDQAMARYQETYERHSDILSVLFFMFVIIPLTLIGVYGQGIGVIACGSGFLLSLIVLELWTRYDTATGARIKGKSDNEVLGMLGDENFDRRG